MVACIEKIAYRMNYIDVEQLMRLARAIASSTYGEYLPHVAEQEAGRRFIDIDTPGSTVIQRDVLLYASRFCLEPFHAADFS